MILSIDKTVAELRHNLARQPGPDIIDEARSLKVKKCSNFFVKSLEKSEKFVKPTYYYLFKG